MSVPYYPGSLYTPNLGLALYSVDSIIAENFVILDTAYGAGSSIFVNGTLVESPNLNGTLPAAPSGKSNVIWQYDSNGNVSAYTTGGGGTGAWATLTGDMTETQVAPWDGPTVGVPDTGISRKAAGILAIGNGSAGDFSGTLEATIVNAITGVQINGAATSAQYLRGNGTNFVSSAIQAADVPTLNQNTSGTASNLSGTPALPNGTTATTQTTGDSSTKIATDAFVAAAISAIGGPAWSSLVNPTGNLSLSMGTDTTTFNQTSNTPWLWANTTTGTISSTNASPLLELATNYYTGSTSAQDTWTIGTTLGAGTNGQSLLVLGHSGSTGAGAASTATPIGVSIPSASLDFAAVASVNFSSSRNGVTYKFLSQNSGGLFLSVSPSGAPSYVSYESVNQGFGHVFSGNWVGQAGGDVVAIGNNSSFTGTTGNFVGLDVGANATLPLTYAPTATSSANFYGIEIAPTINVGASVSWTGKSTMLLVNPTLTATGSGSPVINLMDLQVGGVSKFTVDQHGHINNGTADMHGSVSSAPTGIVATNVVVAVGAATATFTVSSTEGFTIGDTVTLSASGWTGGSGLASSTATVTTLTSPTVMILTRASGGPWVAGTYSAQTGTLTQTGGTTVSVTYAVAYTSTPVVVVTPTSNAGAFYISASSNAGFTITYTNSGTQTFNYIVVGNPN